MMSEQPATPTSAVGVYGYLMSSELSRSLPDLRLKPTQRDVLDFIFGSMDPGGVARLTRQDIADRLNISVKTVSTVTSYLHKLGLLWRISHEEIQVNPNAAFKGDPREVQQWPSQWEAAIANMPDAPTIMLPNLERRPPRRRNTNRGTKGRHLKVVSM